MNIEDFQSMINELNGTGGIKIADIPDIDLYMDQVTTFMDNKLGNEKRDKKDKLLTKTMINNYSKAKILTPSKNKRYNKQQIIQLILIYYLKQVLSLTDIHDLFKPFLELEGPKEQLTNNIYDIFLQIKQNSMNNVEDILDKVPEFIANTNLRDEDQESNDVQMLLTVLMLTSQAQACKRTAEAIIDKHFKPAT